MKAHAGLSLLLISVLASSACIIDAQGSGVLVTEDRRFTAQDGVELVVRSFDGAIDVQSWDANEVAVRIERSAPTREQAERLEIRSSQNGNRIVIEAVDPSGDGLGFDGHVSFVVRAPRRITLEARTTDGAIRAMGFDGDVRIETGDGGVSAERLTGQVRIRTGDGGVAVRDASGVVSVGSGDGGIDVQNANGAFDVESGDGGISLGGRFDSLSVHTGDGRVSVDAADGSTVKTSWSLTSGDGAITLRIPGSLDAELRADSDDGRIRADWPDESPARDEDDESDSYRARLGKGGQAIRLQSGDGRIEIRRR